MNNLYDVIIVGAGASGMTASLYASRANLKTLLIEESLYGGQMTSTGEIENYSGFDTITGEELSEKMFQQATSFGADYVEDSVIEVIPTNNYKVVITEDGVYKGKTVIIATGATHKHLGVVGESEFANRGVSYCAICDGAFFKDKELVVVGGGDSAVEEAIYLTKFASKVTIVHRGNQLKAQPILQDRAYKNEKIHILYNATISEIVGTDKVTGVILNSELDNSKHDYKTDGVFIYIGLSPNTTQFESLGILNEQGYIITNEKMETLIDGIYGAGDVREKELRQIITATSDGAIAVQSVQQYINNL